MESFGMQSLGFDYNSTFYLSFLDNFLNDKIRLFEPNILLKKEAYQIYRDKKLEWAERNIHRDRESRNGSAA